MNSFNARVLTLQPVFLAIALDKGRFRLTDWVLGQEAQHIAQWDAAQPFPEQFVRETIIARLGFTDDQANAAIEAIRASANELKPVT